MSNLIRILAASIVCATAAWAQGADPLSPAETPTMIGAFPMQLDVPLAGFRKVKYAWTVTITGRTDAAIALYVDAAAVEITGDIEELATLTAAEVFDVIAARSVAGALELGYVDCAGGGAGGTAVVAHASCVTRSANGFSAASTSLVRRAYTYDCSSGGPVVSIAAIWDMPECASSAEPTAVAGGASID